MRLDKGDKVGAWFACFPRHDRLCCNHEEDAPLDNLGNIDWRPCMNLWALVEYVAKYATKAPKGTKRLAEVLRIAADEVCRYEPEKEGVDLLRKSPQEVFAKCRTRGLAPAANVLFGGVRVAERLGCSRLAAAQADQRGGGRRAHDLGQQAGQV